MTTTPDDLLKQLHQAILRGAPSGWEAATRSTANVGWELRSSGGLLTRAMDDLDADVILTKADPREILAALYLGAAKLEELAGKETP